MKKNVMMRIAAVLLVCVLVTTCGISGTFAKYTTTGTSSDSARVAKWGVNVDAIAGDAFHQGYKEAGTVFIDNEVGASVWAAQAVVAPGTEGILAGFTVTGQPEVDVTITYTADLELTGWTIDTNGGAEGGSTTYCPIVITITPASGAAQTFTFTTGGDIDAFESSVENAIKAFTQSFDAGQDLADGTNGYKNMFTVSWAWAYVGNDDYDTLVGNLNPAPEISLTVNCIVTQVN